jgi:hypothetical protein
MTKGNKTMHACIHLARLMLYHIFYGRNKLECLPVTNLSSLVECLRVKPAYPSEGTPVLDRFLDLHSNIRLGRKGLPGTNALA